MNNWDVRPHITVVFGADDVPIYAIVKVLEDLHKDVKYWESMSYGDVYNNFEVVNDSNIPEEHLLDVMACLRDHVDNTIVNDWLSPNRDLLVDKELCVNISTGIYHGPGCDVNFYYISE